MRRAVVAVLVCALAGCALGDKQALADRVIRASDRLDDAGSASGTLSVAVEIVKSDKDPVVPGPPKIVPGSIDSVPFVIDLEHRAAAVGLRDDDPTSAVLVFRGGDLFQRIAPKTTVSGIAAGLASAASNLDPLVAAYHGITLAQGAGDGAPATTSTTIQRAALQRASRIPREWIAFDYDALDEDDSTKRAGSFAINPVDVVRLLQGVLTGSIERHGERYDANVNRDKAERHLSDDERDALDKVFHANAISKRTFPASVWLDEDGNLTRLRVRLRQSLTSIDRADLTVVLDIATIGDGAGIPEPDRKATARVDTLGQLVTSVARA